MRSRRPVIALIACGLLLTACTPPEPQPTPTPAPTFECTPIFGGDPTTCTQQDYDDLQAELAQYAEAEQIYRDSVRWTWELMAGKEPLSTQFKAISTGSYLSSIEQTLHDNLDSDWTVSGQQDVEWVKPLDRSNQGSDLAIVACVAPGSLKISTGEGPLTDTWLFYYTYFEDTNGHLLIASMKGEATDPC